MSADPVQNQPPPSSGAYAIFESTITSGKKLISDISEELCSLVNKVIYTFSSAIRVVIQYVHDAKEYIETKIFYFISSKVVRSLNRHTREHVQALHENALRSFPEIQEKHHIEVNEVNFTSSDGKRLNGVELNATPNIPMKERKQIIYFLPSPTLWEELLPHLAHFAEKYQVNIACYNYRGAGFSEGVPYSQDTLVNDGKEIARYYFTKGIDPNKTLLHGFSIGGAIAILLAALLAQDGTTDGTNVFVCNERSFISLPQLLICRYPYAGYIYSFFLYLFNWTLNVEQALPLINKKLVVVTHKRDHVIHPPARFKTLAQENSSTLDQQEIFYLDLDELGDDLPPSPPGSHGRHWTNDEIAQYGTILQQVFA